VIVSERRKHNFGIVLRILTNIFFVTFPTQSAFVSSRKPSFSIQIHFGGLTIPTVSVQVGFYHTGSKSYIEA
jgi:hypothetical protein